MLPLFLFFSLCCFSLSLAHSLISHFQFASPLFPPLFVFLCLTRAHVSAIFFSSLTSASSLLLLSLTVLHHLLSKHLPLPPSSPFYLSLSHDWNSPHCVSKFSFALTSPLFFPLHPHHMLFSFPYFLQLVPSRFFLFPSFLSPMFYYLSTFISLHHSLSVNHIYPSYSSFPLPHPPMLLSP